MKNIITAIILLQLITLATYGQQVPQPDYRQVAAKETDILTQRLGLDSAQKQQIAKVNEAYFKSFFENRKPMDTTARTRQFLKSNYENRNVAYRKILTPAQFTKYEQDMAAVRNRIEQQNSAAKANAMQQARLQADSLRSRQAQQNH